MGAVGGGAASTAMGSSSRYGDEHRTSVHTLRGLKTDLTDVLQDQSDSNRQVCSGMYSRKSWGGNVDPYIMVNFVQPDEKPEGQEQIVSLVIFEWRDRQYVGAPPNPDDPEQVSVQYEPASFPS